MNTAIQVPCTVSVCINFIYDSIQFLYEMWKFKESRNKGTWIELWYKKFFQRRGLKYWGRDKKNASLDEDETELQFTLLFYRPHHLTRWYWKLYGISHIFLQCRSDKSTSAILLVIPCLWGVLFATRSWSYYCSFMVNLGCLRALTMAMLLGPLWPSPTSFLLQCLILSVIWWHSLNSSRTFA